MKNILRIIDQTGFSVFVLLASDIFWYFASFLLAYYLRDTYGPFKIHAIGFYLQVVPYVLLLLIAVFYSYGLYEQKRRINKISEIYLVTKSATAMLIFIMAASFLEKVNYSRGLVLLFWGISIVFLNFGRYLIRDIQKALFRRGYGVKNILIIGAGKPGKRLAEKLEEYREFGFHIAGFLDDRTKPKKSQYKFLGQTKYLLEVIKKRDIHEIYISDPSISHEKILEMIQLCENFPV
ncbi:hypothetical protein HZA41_01415, partial [Candidatus Peregrinibacteria bacterium]|nr:hypothetical protein [Candidatus Peregrinibacteria bacterium]